MHSIARTVVALIVAIAVFSAGWAMGDDGKPGDLKSSGRWADVTNAFWQRVSEDVGASSSTPPKSDCTTLGPNVYRCYALWSPNGQSRTFLYQADVTAYNDGPAIVSNLVKAPAGD